LESKSRLEIRRVLPGKSKAARETGDFNQSKKEESKIGEFVRSLTSQEEYPAMGAAGILGTGAAGGWQFCKTLGETLGG